MLKENKNVLLILAVIAVLSLLIGVVPLGVMVVHARNDDSPENRACYNAGFADGRQNNRYSQTAFDQCGINGRAYYEGFLSGCISGQGKNYFSCQQLTNSPTGGGGGSNNNFGGSGGFSNRGGGGGFGPSGGGGSGSGVSMTGTLANPGGSTNQSQGMRSNMMMPSTGASITPEVFKSMKSQMNVNLVNATVIAEKSVGNNSQAVSSVMSVQNGHLIYDIWVIDASLGLHQIAVDGTNGKVLS